MVIIRENASAAWEAHFGTYDAAEMRVEKQEASRQYGPRNVHSFKCSAEQEQINKIINDINENGI
tara:strand:- start:147 stop:341 length:195 start_codon:yes stop_codon:yes gene_type:complete